MEEEIKQRKKEQAKKLYDFLIEKSMEEKTDIENIHDASVHMMYLLLSTQLTQLIYMGCDILSWIMLEGSTVGLETEIEHVRETMTSVLVETAPLRQSEIKEISQLVLEDIRDICTVLDLIIEEEFEQAVYFCEHFDDEVHVVIMEDKN